MENKHTENGNAVQNGEAEEKSNFRTIIKVDTLWQFIADYLEFINYTGAKCDKEFMERFDRLIDYVHDKIALPRDFYLADEYVVYEVEPLKERA